MWNYILMVRCNIKTHKLTNVSIIILSYLSKGEFSGGEDIGWDELKVRTNKYKCLGNVVGSSFWYALIGPPKGVVDHTITQKEAR